MPCFRRSVLVTNRSSPTSWTVLPKRFGQHLPTLPIVFGHAVFDRDDGRVLTFQVDPILDHLCAGPFALIGLLEDVLAVREELAGRGIEGDPDVDSGLVTSLFNGFMNDHQSFFVGPQTGRKAAFVTDRRGIPALLQHALQRVEHLDAPAQGFGELRGAIGRDHELLKVHRRIGVCSAVDDVHHGDGENTGADAAQVAIERCAFGSGSSARERQRDSQNGIRSETALVGGSVQVDHHAVEFRLLCRVVAFQRLGDLAIDVGHGFRGPFAEVAVLITVPEFHSLMLAGGSAGRNGSAAHGTVR